MTEKDTGELEHELTEARGVEGFFEENADGLRRLSAADYLAIDVLLFEDYYNPRRKCTGKG